MPSWNWNTAITSFAFGVLTGAMLAAASCGDQQHDKSILDPRPIHSTTMIVMP